MTVEARAQALLASEGPIDLEAVQALSLQIRAAPPETAEARDRLVALMQQLAARTRDELQAVGQEMRGIRDNRRALKGYGHLRSSDRDGQRADKLV